MTLKYVFIISCLFICSSCALPRSGKRLMFQTLVCFPSDVKVVDNVRLGFITKGSMISNSKLRQTNFKTVGGSKLYQNSFGIDNAKWRRLVIDLTNDGKSLFVYELDIPKYIRKLDWSEWTKPDFVQQGDYITFMVMEHSAKGVTSPPKDAPKIMFRVLDEYLYWDYNSGRKIEKPILFPECK